MCQQKGMQDCSDQVLQSRTGTCHWSDHDTHHTLEERPGATLSSRPWAATALWQPRQLCSLPGATLPEFIPLRRSPDPMWTLCRKSVVSPVMRQSMRWPLLDWKNTAVETQPQFTHVYSPGYKWAPKKFPNLNSGSFTKHASQYDECPMMPK